MVSRHWAGVFRAHDAAKYRAHLTEELFPKLAQLEGFQGGSILQRDLQDGEVEFLVTSNWASMDDVKRFAGEQVAVAVVPEKIQRMAIRYDKAVRHYDVVYP